MTFYEDQSNKIVEQRAKIARLLATLETQLEAHNYDEVLEIARKELAKECGMSEKHDAMWGAGEGEYIADLQIEIARLRAALEKAREYLVPNVTPVEGVLTEIIDKALAKEEEK